MKLPDPTPVETVVSIPILYAADEKKIRWAEHAARLELAALARTESPDLEIVGIELVESGPHYFKPTELYSFMFRATPVWRKGAKRQRPQRKRR